MQVKRKADSKSLTKQKRKSIWKDRNTWELFLLCIPALVGYIMFNYIPIFTSLQIPFKDYKFSKGILGSEFVGLYNFKFMFASDLVGRAIRNTFLYGLWFMLIGTLTNVILALLLFEVTNRKALKVYQTTVTLPNFMSMVIVGYITYAILSPKAGVLNHLLVALGGESIDAYMNAAYWPAILTIVKIWKGIGMGSLMYFASLMGIDPSLFEAAEIDGAKRFQRIRYISIPHLIPLICIFLIMGADDLISGNFDLFYVIPRDVSMLYRTTDILNTYVYRALQLGDYSIGAAVSLLQSVVGMILVIVSNMTVKKISPENSMF